jgi:hypothetical protein
VSAVGLLGQARINSSLRSSCFIPPMLQLPAYAKVTCRDGNGNDEMLLS